MSSQPENQTQRARARGLTGRREHPVRLPLVCLALLATVACASGSVDKSTDQTRQGTIAADQGYWEEAEFRWLKALAIANLNARALNNLAVRQERLGEFASAKDYYDKALSIATPAERFYIDRNFRQFEPIWERIESGEVGIVETSGDPASYAADVNVGPTVGADGLVEMPLDQVPEEAAQAVGLLEVDVSVPDQGPNLAGFDRVLVGNFVRLEGSETNLNDFAVRYFRRRITQRTFFETQDLLESAAEVAQQGAAILDDHEYWMAAAAAVDADLILTGSLGMTARQESQMVRERIRSPDGQIREVARFQDSVVYRIQYDYVVLRGDDGEQLLQGTLEAEQGFPADEGIAETEAVFETLEDMLPQLLDTITPRRSEQSRYLIY